MNRSILTIIKNKKSFFFTATIFLVTLLVNESAFAQMVNLPCQEEDVATLGLDRKNWNGGITTSHSEASMHNFDLPMNTFGNCKFISDVDIQINVFNLDISNLPADCPAPVDYYINITTGCPSFAPASCDPATNLIYENGGAFVTQSLSFTSPPEDFQWGDNLGIDIVPVMVTGCSAGQNALSSGSIVLDYQICVTVTVSNGALDTPPDLGNGQTICPEATITLDAGTYAEYNWAPTGEMTQTIDVGPGTYTVTVTDTEGCTGTDVVNIASLPTSNITFDPIAPAVCDNGDIAVSVNENYMMYNWSNSLTGQTVNLSPGMYEVTITDNNNCTAVNSINVSNVPPPNAGIDNFLDVCNDGTAYDIDALLLAHDTGGSWSDDDGSGVDVNINPMATVFTNVIPGTYNFTYTVAGSTPCPADQAIITIEIFEQNFAGTSDNIQFCSDPGNIDFVLALGNPDSGGNWSDLDGAAVDLNDPFAVNFDGVAPGTYNFEYLLLANGPCQEQAEILTVVILDSPSAGSDNSTTVCEGTFLDLNTLINGASNTGIFFDTDGSNALSGSIVNTAGLAGQSFNFTFIVGSTSSPCGQDEAIFTVNIESSLSAGSDALGIFCTNGDIDLYDVLLDEDQGGTFVDVNGSGGLMGNILNTDNIIPGTYSYQYLIGDGVTCPQDDAEITIEFIEDPSYDFVEEDLVVCEEFCEEIEINLTGTPPFNIPLEVYSTVSGDLIVSTDTIIDSNTFTFTACNSSNAYEFDTDTLNLISDSAVYIIIPMISDLNCTIESIDLPDTLFINPSSYSFYNLDTTACISDTLMIDGVMLFDGNETYVDTIPGINCDSIININVNFLEADTIMIDTILCLGDSVFIEGIWFSETLQSAEIDVFNPDGCDSLVIVDVSFFPLADFMMDVMLCKGDSIIVNGTVYNESNQTGTEILHGQSQNGCDSIIFVSLSFSDNIMILINDTLCPDASVDIGGQTFNMDNPTDQVIISGAGCDTIVDVDLSFYEIADSMITGPFCPDFSITLNGTIYDINNKVGSEVIPILSQNGCDSIVNLNLQFFEEADSTISGFYCSDFFIDVNGTTYDINMPMGSETLTSQSGCDSIVNINLEFFAPVEENFTDVICDNDSIVVNGNVYNSMNAIGSETIIGGSINGCDSTVNIQLDILQTYYDSITINRCEGDSIFAGGAWQFVSGSYIDNFQSVDLCDSIIITELIVNPCAIDIMLSATDNDCALDSSGSITLAINSDIPLPYTITWQGQNNGANGSIFIDSDQDMVVISDLISDDYNIIIQDAGGSPIYQSTSTVIDINPVLSGVWIVTDAIPCFGETGSIEFQLTGGLTPYSFNWNSSEVGNTATAQNIVAGEYLLTVTDQAGCTLDTFINLTEPQEFTVLINPQEPSCLGVADGEISILEISGGVGPYATTINGATFETSTVSDLDTGSYLIEIFDTNGCLFESTVELIAGTVSDLGDYTEYYIIEEGESVQMEGTADSSYRFEWIDPNGSLSCDLCMNPIANPTENVTYSLTISDSLGCTQQILINVEVLPVQLINTHPNIFSPNGDNMNDEFTIKLNDSGILGMSMFIYDRWGNLVHAGQSIENEISWDGTRNGSALNVGVYVYKIIIQNEDGTTEIEVGDVTLIH